MGINSTGRITQKGKTKQTKTPVGALAIFFGGWLVDGNPHHTDVIDYITIKTLSNAVDFGDLSIETSNLCVTSNGSNDRGISASGTDLNDPTNVIEYVTITSKGNSADFGDLNEPHMYSSAVSNGTNDRGVILFGEYGNFSYTDKFEYVTISSAGNAAAFGTRSAGGGSGIYGCSNGTGERGVFTVWFAGGADNNTLEYITISSGGDSTDFGDITDDRTAVTALSNDTNERGLFAGGSSSFADGWNAIDWITISSTGNAASFGILATGSEYPDGASSGTDERGIIATGQTLIDENSVSSNIIEYVTISTTGNAVDFGDLTIAKGWGGATSNAAA